MDVHINADLEAKLTRVAARSGRNPEMMIQEAIERFVDHDDWFTAEVEKGLKAMERGALLTHEEVGLRIEKFLAERRPRD